MKFWVKVLVAISAIVVITFSIWAFFFKESDEVQAYNSVSEMVDYEQSLVLDSKLSKLNSMNYLKDNVENVIGNDTEVKNQIHLYRKLCMSKSVIEDYGENKFYSYIVLDDFVDETIAYYMPYLQTDNVNNKSLKALKNDVDDYIKSLKNLNESIDKVVEYQKAIDGSDVEYEILQGYYKTFYEKYRASINGGAKVLISMMDFIDKSVYSDNIKVDLVSALNDAFARSLNISTSVEVLLEPDYSNDVRIILDKIEQVKNEVNIFFEKEYSEYDFLTSYNKLFNNYKDTLNYVYGCKISEKQQMAEGLSLSNVLENAQSSVICVLNVIGF